MLIMYFVYSLLPLILFLMATWAFLKPLMKVRGQEDGMRYFIMFLSCAGILFLASLIDKSGILKSLVEQFSFGILDYTFVRWFIFPALLFVAAKILDLYDKVADAKKKKARSEKYKLSKY